MTTSIWTNLHTNTSLHGFNTSRQVFVAHIAQQGVEGTPIHILAQTPQPNRYDLLEGHAQGHPDALAIDLKTYHFRLPQETEWANLGRRKKLQRMLFALIEQRLTEPGVPITADDLMEHVWPGEKMMRSAAQNRLYVTVAMLRRSGFQDLIVNTHGGYMLSKELEILALTA